MTFENLAVILVSLWFVVLVFTIILGYYVFRKSISGLRRFGIRRHLTELIHSAEKAMDVWTYRMNHRSISERQLIINFKLEAGTLVEMFRMMNEKLEKPMNMAEIDRIATAASTFKRKLIEERGKISELRRV